MNRRSLTIGRDARLRTFLCGSLRCVSGFAALAFALPIASADLLTGGNFEVPSGDLPFWTVEEFYTTGSGGAPNTVTLNTSFQDKVQSPTKSAWLRAFAGGATVSPNNLTNAVISQVVPAIAGEQYNASAWSQFEAQYSGGVDLLNSNSPLGAVASPTVTDCGSSFSTPPATCWGPR